MLKQFTWEKMSKEAQITILKRAACFKELETKRVQELIDKVRKKGDSAIREFTQRFDNVYLKNFQVTSQEFKKARQGVSSETKKAVDQAIGNLEKFHKTQVTRDIKVTTSKGVACEMQSRPIQRVGLYVPGGTAPLISTVMMLGVPSKIAGCPVRILCTPPRLDSSVNDEITYTAERCGITRIYKIGGVQAIAAMGYGTQTVPKVDKIFGPGNSFVTLAKILVSQDPKGAALDLPAGPSELMIVADASANPTFIAADLLSQTEHGEDSQVILITDSTRLVKQVNAEIKKLMMDISRRSIVEIVLKNSCAIIVSTLSEAIKIANNYAPEHLSLQVNRPQQYVTDIKCAGSVFLGPWSSVVMGDYTSGTNHVLPTNGYAKCYGGLSVKDFMKTITFQCLTENGFKNLSKTAIILSGLEGLLAHRQAVLIRSAKLGDGS